MQEDSGSAGPRRPADPAAAGAKPVRIGVYDRPAAAGGRRALYLALAVIVIVLIAWLLLAQRGAAASALLA